MDSQLGFVGQGGAAERIGGGGRTYDGDDGTDAATLESSTVACDTGIESLDVDEADEILHAKTAMAIVSSFEGADVDSTSKSPEMDSGRQRLSVDDVVGTGKASGEGVTGTNGRGIAVTGDGTTVSSGDAPTATDDDVGASAGAG